MARKPQAPPVPRVLDKRQLESAIRGVDRRITDLTSLDVSQITERWDARVTSLEAAINSTLADALGEGTAEYNRYHISSLDDLPISVVASHGWSSERVQQSVRDGVHDATVRLQSLRGLLAERLADASEAETPGSSDKKSRPPGDRVFIVHGRDEAAKDSVARFVSQLGLKPVILHEQPNSGRTIVEKLEQHLDVDFAIVLLTPDDLGRAALEPTELNPRARQNVVLELGLFIGALGRARVCALHKGDIELPTDFSGVVYVRLDDSGGWRLLLARELKQAGIRVDMNEAL